MVKVIVAVVVIVLVVVLTVSRVEGSINMDHGPSHDCDPAGSPCGPFHAEPMVTG